MAKTDIGGRSRRASLGISELPAGTLFLSEHHANALLGETPVSIVWRSSIGVRLLSVATVADSKDAAA